MTNRRTGHDPRGSSMDRLARKRWLGATYGMFCIHCECALTFATMQADRIIPGGSYKRSNIQPACDDCNRARGNDVDWVYGA